MSRSVSFRLDHSSTFFWMAALVLIAAVPNAAAAGPGSYDDLLASEPCDLSLRLPSVPTRPALWFEADGLYPSCEALWWTLSDEVTPEELREAWRSVAASRSRYLAALGDGAAPEDREAVRFFLSGALTPELVPMWMALAAFTEGMSEDPTSTLEILHNLGFDAETTERIRQLATAGMDVVSEGIPAIIEDGLQVFLILSF